MSWKDLALHMPHDYQGVKHVFEKLCRESKAADYYVHVRTLSNAYTTVEICAREFFDEHGHVMDWEPDIPHLLPNWIRISDQGFESTRTVEETTHELKGRGFIFAPAFQNLWGRSFDLYKN